MSRAAAAARLAELRALRQSGKKHEYKVQEAESLYDEVDEDGYKNIVRGRLDRDDFVVGDTGEGYVDDGREEWQNERQQQYGSESEDELPARSKAAKRKREEDREKEEKVNHNINKYFSAKPAAAAAPKVKHTKTADDNAFLEDLLGEVGSTVSTRRFTATKPVKTESRRKTRLLSPPLPDARENKVRNRKTQEPVAALDTPPATQFEDDDDAGLPQINDDDMIMSDAVAPSSPVARAVERKAQTAIKIEEEDDDMMEVAQAVGHSGVAPTSVNIAGARPVPKIVKTEALPTPESSSPPRPTPEVDASSWINVTSKLNVVNSPASETVTIGKLASQDALEEDGSLRFFWFDYTEINGSLLLFGKVKNKKNNTYVSCFVKVDGILRKLFFLPREARHRHGRDTDEEVDMGDVYKEVDGIMSKMRVNMHKIKPSTRKYAFELAGIPKEAEYLKLLYPYDKPALELELKGETFSHVFGTNTSLFEQFVLWKNIMGPCWLKIEDADFNSVTNASWCKLELQVRQAKTISVLEDSGNMDAPPLTIMSIALRTTMNVKANKQEILIASARVYQNVSLSDTTPPEKLPCKTITVMRPVGDGYPLHFRTDLEKHVGAVRCQKTEREVLSLFLAELERIDPDVLMGHRLEDLDYSILLSRMRELNTPGWHRIGRLRRSAWPKSFGKGGNNFFAERQLIAGRLMCDLANDMGKSLMTKCQSWSLAEMCELVLGQGNVRREIDNEQALKTWATTRDGLMNYLKHCEADTYYIAAIALRTQMLPLTKQLTNLAGNSWARTLTGTRAERNEYILLHEFNRGKYICPDKIPGKGKQKLEEEPVEGEEGVDTKKKDKFKGGLVFEPEKGLYDRFVLVMDFNSLYPSIIQEYNICFTTVDRSGINEDDDKVPEVPEEQEQGVLPKLISTLVKRRREVKQLMKDKSATPEQLATWDIRQLALKLTANSMYGCLGYTRSRFYARPLAVLTTYKGREILLSTKELAQSNQLQVIYGDTDSVMINTNMDNVQDALKVGQEFKKAVNERYKLLEIDIDNVFRRLLLHAKKKYAAINMVETDGKFVDKLEVKGLDMRRREYCALSKETSSKLLNFLLSGEEPEVVIEKIHDYLRELATKMREFTVPVQKYTIFTQLGKDPSAYPNGKTMPAVQVALRLIAKGKPVRAKDVMSFIITGDSSNSGENAAANAFPPEDVFKNDSGLKPDIDYYLHKQILPPVERLCAPISLTNVSRLAECLGLDTSKYRVAGAGGRNGGQAQEELIQPLDSQTPDHIRFATCAPLRFRCRNTSCQKFLTFRSFAESMAAANADSPEANTNAVVTHSGISCPACNTSVPNLTIVMQLEHQIRSLLSRYYEGWLVCDDPSCGNRTRQMTVYGHRCLGPRGLGSGCLGRMNWEMGEKNLWNQLVFWERAFDVEKAKGAALRIKAEGNSDVKDKMAVLAEVNRERFGTCKGVVKSYLDKSGRQWVDMGSLFGFVKA